MFKDKRVYCFIPARGGSKGIPHKNKLLIAGKPLIQHSINTAKNISIIDEIFVSTDDDDIKKISTINNLKTIDRPDDLATDSSNILDVFKHMINYIPKKYFNKSIIVIFFPTAPIRNTKKLIESFDLYDDDVDCVISVVKSKIRPSWIFLESNGEMKFWQKGIPEINRQQQENYYYLTGSIIITSPKFLMKQKNIFLGGKIKGVILDEKHGIDIDTKLDFQICEFLMKSL